MKRAFVFVAALSLAGTAWITSTAATPAASCANPVTLTGTTGGVAFPDHYRVNQDQWSGQGQQSMSVCDQTNWTATANQKGKPASGVKTYPDSERTFTDWSTCASQPALSSFATLTSSYSIVAPPASTSYDAAYDLFIGGGACAGPSVELMVWSRWRHIDVPAAQPVTIGGVTYDIFHSGSYIQVRQHKQSLHGTVDLLAICGYLEGQGLLSSSSTLLFVQYGFELLTSHGKDVPLSLTGFSVSDSRLP